MFASNAQALLAVAKQAALSAGKLLKAHYGKLKASQISTKSKNDFVTELDKKSEQLIISIIKKNFPDHAIVAEESGKSSGAGDILWVIDPLDGTSNYIHHFPLFSVSIGILIGGEPATGVVFDPIHEEIFTAIKGKGAYLNGRKIRVSRTALLQDAFMTTGIPFRARERFDRYMESFREISVGSVGMRRGGSAALDLCYVACGRFDGFWEIDLAPWDIAAGALMVTEAGGKITDPHGQGHFLKGDIVASNGKIQRELLAITSRIFPKKIESI
jgi:myo-inositol-1(or 4)-monophosphatase